MTNREVLSDLDYENLIVFENPDYDSAIVGVSHDDRVVYDYDKMVEYLVDKERMSATDAEDFIFYNTIRALSYTSGNTPIVMFPI
jgi:hypothetical protein